MKSQNQSHLNEEQIIRAVIDEKDLTGEDRQHFMNCQLCTSKVALFKDDLQELGDNARVSVPSLRKNISLPGDEETALSYKSRWLPSFGVAVMAGLVLFFYVLGLETMSPKFIALQSPEDLLEDEYLMEDILEMVENPLSESIYEITGVNGGFDEEFLQFVVPDVQYDFQSKLFIHGGIKQC
jgi:hypothetical protein